MVTGSVGDPDAGGSWNHEPVAAGGALPVGSLSGVEGAAAAVALELGHRTGSH